jgi:hypothetical protein
VSDLERQISRYLDGESTPDELEYLRLTLSESPEARALLRELTAIRGAARGGATMRRPSRRIESELFRRLRTEGLYAEKGGSRPAPIQNTSGSVPRAAERRNVGERWSALAAALALLLVIGSGYLLDRNSTRPLAVVNRTASPSVIDMNFGDAVAIPPLRMVTGANGAVRTVARSGRLPVTGGVINKQPSIAAANTSSIAPSQPVVMGQQPDRELTAMSQPTLEQKAAVLLPSVLPNEERGETGLLAASFRPRVAYIGRGDGAFAGEMDIRLDARLGEAHSVSLILGSSASVVETRHRSTGIFVSRAVKVNPDGSPDRVAASKLVAVKPYQMEVQQEVWAGLGYNYSVALPVKNMHTGAGLTLGTSASSWRVGLEVPVSLRVSKGMTVELAGSATHIVPRDRSISEFTVDNSSDGILYQGERERSAFTSYGVELGVRLDLP